MRQLWNAITITVILITIAPMLVGLVDLMAYFYVSHTVSSIAWSAEGGWRFLFVIMSPLLMLLALSL